VHVLVYILDKQLSGTLVVHDTEGKEHCVYFLSGAPAKVHLEAQVALLGEQLVSARVLSPTALETVIQAARKDGTLLGKYLERFRFASPTDIDRALRLQIVQRLSWLATLSRDARYEFYRDRNLLESWGGDMTPCEPLGAILCAMRAWNDHDRIHASFMKNSIKDAPIRLHPEAVLDGIQLTAQEDRVATILRTQQVTLAKLYGDDLSLDYGTFPFLYMLFATRQLQMTGQERPPMRAKLPEVSEPSAQRLPPEPPRIEPDVVPVGPRGVESGDRPAGKEDDYLTYDSYPTLESNVSAVAQRVVTDMKDIIASSMMEELEPLPKSTVSLVPDGIVPTAHGQLGRTPLVHVLTYMFDHQATGTVVLQEPDGTEHMAYFENGAAVKAKTGNRISLLGEMLVAEGQLNASVVETAVNSAREIGTLLGEYLILDGLASRKAVIRALENQVVAKIVALTNLPDDSRYAYYAGVNFLSHWAGDDLFPANPLTVILAVSRVWSVRQRVRSALHKIVDRRLRFHPDNDVGRMAAADADLAVISAIMSGNYTLRQLHEKFPTYREDVNSLVYALAITRQFALRKDQKPPMRVGGVRRSQQDADSMTSMAPRAQAADEPSRKSIEIPTTAPKPLRKPMPPMHVVVRPGPVAGVPAARPSMPTLDDDSASPLGRVSVVSVVSPDRRGPPPIVQRVSEADKQRANQDFLAAMDAMKRGDLDRAERLVKQAATTAPGVPEHAALGAWIRASSSAHPSALNGAVATLTNIINTQPACELALLYRAKILRRNGTADAALEDIERILALNPNHREAQGEARLLRSVLRARS